MADGDGIDDAFDDDDNDGLINLDEWLYGTDPQNPDTDGDGVPDGQEADQGSNPNDPSDGGQAPPPEDLVEVTLTIGDHSGSHSERWLLKVGYTGLAAPGYGQVVTGTRKLRRGASYEITVVHLGTNLPEGPDYDYTAHVTPEPDPCAFVDDPFGLLGVHWSGECPSGCNPAEGKEATLMLPKGNLTVYRPNTPPFQLVDVPDEIEETSNDPAVHPGAGVRFNGDDDNFNGVPDHTESPVTNENDLLRLEVTGDPPFLPDTYEWVVRRSNPAIKLWKAPTKTFDELFGDDNIEVIELVNVWFIEWVDPALSTATLEVGVREVGDTEVCVVDTIALYRFTSIVIALGGETHVPADPPTEPTNHGTFVLAIDLYQQGYNVHMYDEANVLNNGSGATYNDVDSAVQNQGITEVAIFGYSHGGGSTHDLAERLWNFPPPTGTFAIPFTAYIDAVTQGTITEENRRPPLTVYHVNYYQANGPIELGGGPVPNSNPPPTGLDVAGTPWGANATHGSIDDLGEVLIGIKSQLTSRVTR